MVEAKPFVVQNPNAEVEAKTKPEVKLEAEDEEKAQAQTETIAEEADEVMRFDKSLQELKDLRSQLHNAADYCQATFRNAAHKHMVINNTKEYLCRAIVTVVDHLGSTAANLNQQVSETDSVCEIEISINTVKQKLATCQQYSQKLALHKLSWHADFPRYHSRYIMQPMPILRRSNAMPMIKDAPNGKTRTIKKESERKTETSLVSFKYKPLPSDSSILSKINGFSKPGLLAENALVIQPKPLHQLSQLQEKRNKIKHRVLNWKPKQKNDLMSLVKLKRLT